MKTLFSTIPAFAAMLIFGGSAAQAAGKACPATTFPKFLTAFAADPALQRAHTRIPLSYETIDATAQPEPRTVRKMLDAKTIRFPIMPSPVEQKKKHMTSLNKVVPGGMEVTLRAGETDEQLRFFFRQESGCWTLLRKSDDSL
ncbi:hypothetical protein ACSBM8_07040 [Sphingomonas sp. ASY06-1R]|uniref:hypothetical protein n=1 Tax=Sphingomonas sp. ASY06-1R TaxID=3445771 RepID=UPI003FA241B8